MFDDFGDQFSQHITGPHNDISLRLAALEKEATAANAQRLDLQQRQSQQCRVVVLVVFRATGLYRVPS